MRRLLLCASALLAMQLQAEVKVTNLSVEGRKDQPLGLDVQVPRLGWQLVADADETNVLQTGYHILVASHPDTLTLDRGDLWDAEVSTDQSLWIDYMGIPLKPNQRVYWKVRASYTAGPVAYDAVYNSKRDMKRAKKAKTSKVTPPIPYYTAWSDVSMWGAGLLNEGNWKGQWIGYDHANYWDVEDVHSRLSARYFRTSWPRAEKGIKQATLHICGLGVYEAYINGRKVGRDMLAPAPTNYDKSIIYNTYDVTDLLLRPKEAGRTNIDAPCLNGLGITVSNGRYYTMQQGKKKYKIRNFGYPKLRANLIIEYIDGTQETITTNEKQWLMTCDGPIRSSNEYDGEIYDARHEFSDDFQLGEGTTLHTWAGPYMQEWKDDKWTAPERCEIPDGWLRGNTTPNMQVIDTLGIKNSIITRDGRLLIDFGQNFAGNVLVNIEQLKLQEGDTLRVRWAEKLVSPIGAPWTPEQSRLSNGPGYCLTDTSELYVENLRNAESTDLYISRGKDHGYWTPLFCYHGGRFVEITISPANGALNSPLSTLNTTLNSKLSTLNSTKGLVISDPMETLYTFETPNPLLNQIINNAFWGVRSNYKGMPVDCPQRDERQPWVGDHSMGCWGESYLMDNRALYLKWMQDLEDSQKSDGTLPGVAPAYWNYYNDDISWPSVFVFGADMLYTQYGDVEAIRRHYPAMRRWVMHFWNEHRDPKKGVVKADKYADWCCPPEAPELIHSQDPNRVTDGVLIGSCYLYRLFQDMMKFDDILAARIAQASDKQRIEYAREGLTIELLEADREEYRQIRTSLREAINREFLNDLTRPDDPKAGRSPSSMTAPDNHILYPDSIFYSNNSVTANLLPWAFGIVPDEHAATVERWIMRKHLLLPGATPELKNIDGHIQCGVIGMSWLLRGLADMGRMDVAYMLATVHSYPSWGYMVEHGATTIWELWNGDTANPKMNSGNHIMLLGDLIPWCMEDIVGIKSAAPGFKQIRFAPHFELEELPSAQGSYKTPYGLASSRWEKDDRQLVWDITVPCNTTAQVVLPFNAIVPSGTLADTQTSKKVNEKLSMINSRLRLHTIQLGSGQHHLVIDLDPALPARDYYKGGAYERQHADSLAHDRQGILCDQFVYDFTTAAHPSVHSASVAELNNGDLLATFFLGAREGAPDVCIYTARKPKDATDWEPLQLVANGDLRQGAKTYGTEIDSTLTEPIVTNVNRKACYNPVLFQIPDGDLLLFYKIGKNVRDWTGYMMRSSDDGKTWSDPRAELAVASHPTPSSQLSPVQCSDSLLGAIKNQPIYLPAGFRCANGTVLEHGRILSPSSKETGTASKEKSGKWRSYIEVSEDDGYTWALYGPVPQASHIGTIQPALLVHPDGRIQMLCRTHRPSDNEAHYARIATAFSDDGGLTWGEMQLIEDLPNNNSGIGAVTLKDGTFALVYNPFSLVPGPDKPLRNPCCIATSHDGLHWEHRLTLESSPISQYSYPSLLMGSDGTLHAIYTWRRQGIKYQRFEIK